jgi:uncharacterized membrane protein
MSRRSHLPSIGTSALCLLAFILRLSFIASPSLRGDEALSVIYAQRSLPDIVEISRFTSGHPPTFYGLLHFWAKAAGTSEFAARYFSAWWGVLVVPLGYALGRALFGTRSAAWAALLLAINPFHIWHAQDVRSYSMLVALGLLSCWAFWHALRRPTWRTWGRYAVAGVAVVYCHYFGAFLVLSHGLYWLASIAAAALSPHRSTSTQPGAAGQGRGPETALSRGVFLRGAAAFAVIAMALLPWLWLARTVLTGEHGPGGRTLPLWEIFGQSLLTFGIGYWREPWGRLGITAALALLLGWGAWSAFRRNAPGAGFLVLVMVVPALALFLLSRSRPIYRERYLAFTAPAYSLLIAVGLAAVESGRRSSAGRLHPWLRRIVLAVCLAFLIGLNAYALVRYYVAPAYAKSPEWRKAVAAMRERLAPHDVVILNHQDQALLYYYEEPNLHVLPAPGGRDAESVQRALQDIVSSSDRVWLIPDTARLWDRKGLVRRWLDQTCELTWERAWRGVLVLRYHTPRSLVREQTPLDVRFGDSIRLLGYTVRDQEGIAVDRLQVGRGDPVRLTLYWLAEDEIERDYVVFTHLLDGTGRLWGQQDNQPRQGTFPTRAWVPGEWVIDAYRIPVATDAPLGDALLEVGLYDPASGARLPVGGGDGDAAAQRVLLEDVVQIVEK